MKRILSVAAVLVLGLAVLPAAAQTATTTTTTTTTTITEEHPSEWMASGFVGSSFGIQAQQATADFGASLAYLHHGAIGVEFLAGFAPKMKLNRLAGLESDVNNYMANVIAAVPIGMLSRVHPFVSAGVGAMTLSLNNDTDLSIARTGNAVFSPDQTQFAANVGAGIMAFGPGHWGIKADVRYLTGIGNSGSSVTTSTTGPLPVAYGVPDDVLRKTSFWRANVGIAARW